MKTVKLNNGVEMPILGYGVFQVAPDEAARCVEEAIGVGYRSIDTAQAYYNEEGVGQGIKKSGVPRVDLFLTTKVWVSNAGEQKAAASIDESLRKLGTDYIDLLLIHQHYGDYYGTWRAMEQALKAGKVRAIGVSNFDEGRFTDLVAFNEVTPAVNQLQTNVFYQQQEQQKFLSQYGATLMAWSPLTQGRKDFFTQPVLTEIAEAHGKSVAQVALHWLTQRGVVVIPKSTHRERMAQNLDVFDFELTNEEMERIATLNEKDHGNVNFDDPAFIKYLTSAYK